MKQLPFPFRVAAGLAVTTAERVRDLPKQLTELPVTVAGHVAQASMRVQQHVTDLAIKGDTALSSLHPVDEAPSWATFDEDLEPPAPTTHNGHGAPEARTETDTTADPADAADAADAATDDTATPPAASSVSAPAGLPNYDELTLPQLRARLRRLSLAELEELLAYERTHANRSSFTGMLARRVANVRRQATGDDDNDDGASGPAR